MDRYQFGNYIYKKRKELNLTQEELGRKLGLTNKAISKWETGETMPEVVMLPKLAKELNISVDELLTQEPMKKETITVVKNKYIGLYILIVSLLCNLICLIFLFQKNESPEPAVINDIELNFNNMEQYLKFENNKYLGIENNVIKIETKLSLIDNYQIVEQVVVNANYNLHYTYKTTTTNTYSFFNLKQEYILVEKSDLKIIELSLPKEIHEDAKFISIEVEYSLQSISGTIKGDTNE